MPAVDAYSGPNAQTLPALNLLYLEKSGSVMQNKTAGSTVSVLLG